MKLFPESQEWVCTVLINPNNNEINQRWIKVFNNYIEVLTRGRNLNSWTFDEFVNLLNGVLSLNPTETEEMELFYNDIFKPQITQIGLPYINNWDLAGLFLIIRKMMEENLTTCENPIIFIMSNLHKLKPHMYSEDVDADNYRYGFFPNNFTCTQIEDDDFMRDFFYSNLFSLEDGDGITITDLLNSRNSHFLLNDSFKMLCYENIDSEQGFLLIPEALRNDINFIKKLLKNNGNVLEFLSNDHKGNKELVLIAVEAFSVKDVLGRAFCFAAEELQSNREFIIACLERNKNVFRYLSTNFRSDRKIVLHAVKLKGNNLEYAAKELQDDLEFIISVVNVNADAFKFVSDNLKGNRAFLIEVVSKNGLVLEYIDEILKENRKIVLAAVKNNGLALKFVLEEFKTDEEIVFEAVVQNGLSLKYAAEELKNNKEFMKRINNI